MIIIWMKAGRDEIQTMKGWVKQFITEARNARMQTPPVLRRAELDELKCVFEHYDSEGVGELSFDRLVTLGLIDEDQKDKCQQDWDADGNGILDLSEFCEMMCPSGHRATKESVVGSLRDGTRVRFDPVANYWRRVEEGGGMM